MVELPQSCNIEKVKLKCSQEGKIFTAKISDLTREDMEPLSNSDFYKGSVLLCDIRGKAGVPCPIYSI